MGSRKQLLSFGLWIFLLLFGLIIRIELMISFKMFLLYFDLIILIKNLFFFKKRENYKAVKTINKLVSNRVKLMRVTV